MAIGLVDQVHNTLGKHHPMDADGRHGWLSGLPDAEVLTNRRPCTRVELCLWLIAGVHVLQHYNVPKLLVLQLVQMQICSLPDLKPHNDREPSGPPLLVCESANRCRSAHCQIPTTTTRSGIVTVCSAFASTHSASIQPESSRCEQTAQTPYVVRPYANMYASTGPPHLRFKIAICEHVC
jgi:hypothetical protein